MMVTVVYENEESEAFAVNNGVKQGCVLAPVLFNSSSAFRKICTVMQEFWALDKFEENSDDAPGILRFEYSEINVDGNSLENVD